MLHRSTSFMLPCFQCLDNPTPPRQSTYCVLSCVFNFLNPRNPHRGKQIHLIVFPRQGKSPRKQTRAFQTPGNIQTPGNNNRRFSSPAVHVLLDPSLPSNKTDSMVFGVHAFKIQQSCLPCFRCFDIPTPLQPSIYRSFHMSSF